MLKNSKIKCSEYWRMFNIFYISRLNVKCYLCHRVYNVEILVELPHSIQLVPKPHRCWALILKSWSTSCRQGLSYTCVFPILHSFLVIKTKQSLPFCFWPPGRNCQYVSVFSSLKLLLKNWGLDLWRGKRSQKISLHWGWCFRCILGEKNPGLWH